jgi:hypothetical protein
MPLESRVKEVKPVSGATCRRYEVAPLTGFQVSVGVLDVPVEPLSGEIRTGAEGGNATVVKIHEPEYGPLWPCPLVAFKRQ